MKSNCGQLYFSIPQENMRRARWANLLFWDGYGGAVPVPKRKSAKTTQGKAKAYRNLESEEGKTEARALYSKTF